jgi:DNA-binding NtrC family response regulator
MRAAAWAEAGEPDLAVDAMAKAPPREPREGAAPADRSVKVLLVDDEEDYVRTMAERMEMRDLGSEVALTGEQALDMLEADLPDVMVLDMRMPGMNGMEVLARVKEAHPQVEVIVLTGFGTAEDEEEARRLGAFDYLRKPVDIGDLMSTIRRAARSRVGGP